MKDVLVKPVTMFGDEEHMREMATLLRKGGKADLAEQIGLLSDKLGRLSDNDLTILMEKVNEVAGQHTSLTVRRMFRSSRQACHTCAFEMEGEAGRRSVTI